MAGAMRRLAGRSRPGRGAALSLQATLTLPGIAGIILPAVLHAMDEVHSFMSREKGMAGMAEVGIKALSGLKWEVAEPLLAEMWQCVQIMPDPSKPHVVRNLIEEDIEEISTRVKLRAEVWKLHTGFLKAVAPSISGGSPAAASKRGSRNT